MVQQDLPEPPAAQGQTVSQDQLEQPACTGATGLPFGVQGATGAFLEIPVPMEA
ncbi:MAG: hypothetical protein ACLTDX_09495 [[Clostridium] innocuum]